MKKKLVIPDAPALVVGVWRRQIVGFMEQDRG
jgi:hypothetical protein